MSRSDLATDASHVCKCSEARRVAQAATSGATDSVTGQQATGAADNGVTLAIDVSNLPPPLPMVRILETLRDLGPGETLLVHHTRRPIHLYPKLEALGCTHETTDLPSGAVSVRITNPPASLP